MHIAVSEHFISENDVQSAQAELYDKFYCNAKPRLQ